MSKRQTEEIAKFCLDLSKLILTTWVLGIFVTKINPLQLVVLIISGLILSIMFFIIGIRLLRKIK